MTELEWLGSSDPAPMLRYLREQGASERKLRLLACACCRRIWHLLPDPRSRLAVEVAERFADDRASLLDLARARTKAVEAVKGKSGPDWAAYWTTNVKASGPIWNVFAAASTLSMQTIRASEAEYDADLAVEFRRQVALVYEVIGNPFRPSRLDPFCLAWGDGLVRQLAEGIYEDRAFDRMPVLGDALEDAGCRDVELLAHCREHREHVRGCWVLDMILGRD
jgi:hypothetical protein